MTINPKYVILVTTSHGKQGVHIYQLLDEIPCR